MTIAFYVFLLGGNKMSEHTHENSLEEQLRHDDMIREAMQQEELLYYLADLFKVLGDATRIRILCVLYSGELCVNDIADALGMTTSAISHQLRTLKQSRLVKFRREGKTIFYALDDDHIFSILRQGMEHIQE